MIEVYQTLKSNSVMLIGERFKSKLVWIQLFDSTQSITEDELRKLLREVKSHILKDRIKSGSARKFLDGKLVYYELSNVMPTGKPHKIYCLFTHEQKIGLPIKKSMESIAHRGGGHAVYSANRFFSEVIDLASQPEKLDVYGELTIIEVINRIDNYYNEAYDVNELGQIISFLSRSEKLDWETLEKIYFQVYESVMLLKDEQLVTDPDEFLDAAYTVAIRYQQIDKFRLGLELLKHIIPVARKNLRYDLETACKIGICTIYKYNFPDPGEYILDELSSIDDVYLQETAKTHREIYYCLLGYAYDQLNHPEKALEYYNLAIQEADMHISSPTWIAEAYGSLGKIAHQNYYLMEAARHYLTASTISFSAGDLKKADDYRNDAAGAEIFTSYSLVHSAHIDRMEGNLNDAEYRAWDALRQLIRAFQHSNVKLFNTMFAKCRDILQEAEIVLNIPGKMRRNRSVINKIRKFVEGLQSGEFNSKIDLKIEELAQIVEENIPLPPPTFMLLTIDGLLIMMGRIVDNEWMKSEIEGVILGGILSAIMSLVTEVTGQTSLRTIDAGNFQIMIEQSENVAAVLLLDRDIPEFRQKLIHTLNFIDEKYGDVLKFWTGKRSLFDGLKDEVVEILSSTTVPVN